MKTLNKANILNIISKNSELTSFEIWIVANVIETIHEKESYVNHTNFSEFFTRAEFALISSAISKISGFTRVFYSELELIEYVLANKSHIDIERTLVFNFSRDGIREGKKSLIPAFCDLLDIMHTSSNPFVISLLRNKHIYSHVLKEIGVNIPKTEMLYSGDDISLYNFEMDKPIIIKAVFESASIGMSESNIIYNPTSEKIIKQLEKSIIQNKIMLQEFIDGTECEVFVVKVQNEYYSFEPIKIVFENSKILTSDISNTSDYSFELLNKSLPKDICSKICSVAEKAAEVLNISHFARFDFRISKEGKYYIIDIAGTPYLTRHSSVNHMFSTSLELNYDDIFLFLAAITIDNYSHDVNCKSDINKPLE